MRMRFPHFLLQFFKPVPIIALCQLYTGATAFGNSPGGGRRLRVVFRMGCRVFCRHAGGAVQKWKHFLNYLASL